MQDDVVGMETEIEDEGARPSLATRLLPSENKQICSLLVRIETELSQITEKPHKQEDREIDCSLVQVGSLGDSFEKLYKVSTINIRVFQKKLFFELGFLPWFFL